MKSVVQMRQILLMRTHGIMTNLYKFYDDKNTVVRLFSNKDEAIGFSLVDRSLRIETVKLFRKQKSKDNYITAYKLLGEGIV